MIYIALLRAVNLGAHNKVAMSDLRALLAELGMQDPQSLLQSGNLVFRSRARPPRQLERVFDDAAAGRLGLKTEFFVRTAREWAAIIADNPFPREARFDPGHLVLMCLKASPDPAAVTALQKAISGRELIRANGRHAYIVYPDGIGRSRLTIAMIEKYLATRGTGRNWNTVVKLGALTGAS